MTLFDGIPGHIYVVESTRLNEKVGRRLEALGLIHGTRLEVLNKKNNGAMIFKARGTRLAVGKEISENIFIEEVRA